MISADADIEAHYRGALTTSGRWATAALCLSGVMVILVAIGVVRGYSPVPFWDMWDGYVGFFLRAVNDGWPAWFEMHNEHRLVLSRLFFYADIAWFDGKGVLPLLAGGLSAAGVALIFCQAVSRTGAALVPAARNALWAICISGTFFWSQRENFVGAFQVQFLLAELLPLLAFWLAATAADQPRNGYYGAAATACAVLALGSMANGILALPLLLVLGACLGLGRAWMFASISVAVPAISGLLAMRTGSGVHASLLNVVFDRPLDVARFVLRYLGGGFWFALGRHQGSVGAAEAAGSLLVASTAFLLPGAWRARRTHPMRLAMLAVVGYVIATALGTALGRLPMPSGAAGALVSRYTGMANMAWVALIVASLPAAGWLRSPRCAPALGVALILGMLTWQIRAVRSQETTIYQRDLASLALSMQVDDPAAIAAIYPAEAASVALDIASRAARAHLPVFGWRDLQLAPSLIGKHVDVTSCQPGIELAGVVDGTPSTIRVDGHLKMPFSDAAHRPAPVLDDHDTIVGWVLPHPKAAHARGKSTQGVPFSGYVSALGSNHATSSPRDLRICQLLSDAPFAYPE